MQFALEKIIADFFARWHGSQPTQIEQLPPSGSNRQYFRLVSGSSSYIVAFNPEARENKAFIWMSRHFQALGFPVPQILAEEPGSHLYLQSDLGDTSLFALLPHDHRIDHFDDHIVDLYKQAIDWLPRLQIEGDKGFDYSICYPRRAFDRHSMMWDLNYFKYYFLKISGIPFDEQSLEDSFDAFTRHLLDDQSQGFMYRDFQSRNIMIVDQQPWFIDFQGGRKGPLQYDIASLLFDAKANIPFALRQELLGHYLTKLAYSKDIDPERFHDKYYDFVLIRVMQALATYGFRGGVEKKALFLQSMPYALRNLKWLADNDHLPHHNPYLCRIIENTLQTLPIEFPAEQKSGLTVSLKSFSYRRGIPVDTSGNGGGFVFDCRVLPNPGRLAYYKPLTGLDEPVVRFLDSQPEAASFLNATAELVLNGIDNYLKRGFDHLSVSFGCTGGQHRSVYCVEQMANRIREKFAVHIDLQHEERDRWPGGREGGRE